MNMSITKVGNVARKSLLPLAAAGALMAGVASCKSLPKQTGELRYDDTELKNIVEQCKEMKSSLEFMGERNKLDLEMKETYKKTNKVLGDILYTIEADNLKRATAEQIKQIEDKYKGEEGEKLKGNVLKNYKNALGNLDQEHHL